MKARFHLPDFAGHFKLNLVFVEFLKQCPQYFREGVEIASVFGAFPLKNKSHLFYTKNKTHENDTFIQ